ncbi:unnamed protein product [Notodromas monacha]|uniref:Peptidase C45 hydrolase domain-containing protein n=1 Tax=Notodromas monacha TaxID=399045 RepID=A0A7R9C148_9CRUS|nr:unnamed protein product [Notodromas monacha]CAG0924969.1 unnamed protein product [Notodromas monacha]
MAIGHTEDLQADLMNECYVTHVHYQDSSEEPRGKLKRTEEQIVSYCYPGDLPGYAMAVSEHLAVTVNELASLEIDPWGTPKGILARAALSCNSVEEMVEILTDKGHGISSGLSFNVMTLSEPKRRLFNIEVACRERDPEGNFLPDRQSRVSVHEVKENEVFFHCNL